MHVQVETGGNRNFIRGYGPGFVTVNETVCHASLVILPDRLITDWPPQASEHIALAHIELLALTGMEVVLIGTGRNLRFPSTEKLAPLARAQIGWEIMDTGAACRTYNILVSEGRKVAAALLMIESGNDGR